MIKMKQLLLFLLLLVVIKFVGAAKDYHGNRRYWTLENSAGETSVALHLLNEPIKIIFSRRTKTLRQITSDIRLRSHPTKQCKEATTSTLGFKLEFNDINYIRGEIKIMGNLKKRVYALLFYVCAEEESIGLPYKTAAIDDDTRSPLTLEGGQCFEDDILFKPYAKDDTKSEMVLTVTGTIKCPTFIILPKYMFVEDAPPLPEDIRLPLNDSFAGHEDGFWWKSGNDPFLPDGISFVGINAQIDILQSTKSKPYFLRIGKDQPIPTFQLKFGETCTDLTFDLYLNLRETADCKISVRLEEDKFELETKNDVVSLNNSKSPMLVFATEADKVYLKDASILSINALGTCKTKNTADVPEDQLVLQLVPSESTCDLAQVTLLANDVVSKKIEVLIDRAKAADIINSTNSNGTNNENSTTLASPLSTTSSTATASIEWWWFVAAGGGILFLVVVAILIYVFCIRPRRRKQKNERQARRRPVTIDEDIFSAQTAIPLPESPKQKKKDKKMKMKKSNEVKVKEKTKEEKKVEKVDESKKSEKEGRSKPSEKQSPYEDLPLPPSSNPPKTPRKTLQDQFSAVQTTQDDPTIKTGSTQNPSLQTQPGTIEKAAAAAATKPSRPKLKHRTMYGPAGFVNMNDPYDYHQNEADTFEPTINFAAIKAGTSPPLLQFENFWNCIDKISIPKRYSPVYVNSKIPGSSVFFMVRDCVADEAIYAPFRSFSNRILEPMKHELKREKSEHSTVDGEKKFFVLRVFILSYEPLTLEIHCRGQCPQFLFNLFDCDECPEIGNRLQKNAWMNSRSTCRDNWDVFLCRVKRTPINTHQFFSYNGSTKPKNSDEVNHVMVIRGDKKPNKLRECIRGCTYPDASHPNNVSLETELQGDPTLQTQNTQPSS